MAKDVAKHKEDAIETILGTTRAVVGVVHLPPLPGSPSYDGESVEDIVQRAVSDASRYSRGGVDGIIIENHGDIPFSKPADLGLETVAFMTAVGRDVRDATGLPLGVNVLANGALQALAIAHASGADFIRVNQWANAYVANEGFVEGPAARATRYRSWIRASDVKIFADVHVKHGAHAIVADRSLEELTRDLAFFDADAIIVTGQRTGDSANLNELRTVRSATTLPLLVGSGVTLENVGDIFQIANAVIVASSLKEDGVWWNPVSEERVRDFMDRVRSLRADA